VACTRTPARTSRRRWTGSAALLGVQEFAATSAGYARLVGWLQGFGTVCLVGIEGTGSYGAGLARHLAACRPPRARRRPSAPRRAAWPGRCAAARPPCQPLPRRAAGRTGRATGPRFTAAVPVRRRRSTSAGLRRTTFAPVPPPRLTVSAGDFPERSTVSWSPDPRCEWAQQHRGGLRVCHSVRCRGAGPTGAILPAAPASIGRLRCGCLPRLLKGLCANTPTLARRIIGVLRVSPQIASGAQDLLQDISPSKLGPRLHPRPLRSNRDRRFALFAAALFTLLSQLRNCVPLAESDGLPGATGGMDNPYRAG
jgi:hypothetical protein